MISSVTRSEPKEPSVKVGENNQITSDDNSQLILNDPKEDDKLDSESDINKRGLNKDNILPETYASQNKLDIEKDPNSLEEEITNEDNTSVGKFEDAPASLLLADPPSGFKDSIADPLLPASPSNSSTKDLEHRGLRNTFADDLSCGSDSFDQAINKIAASQESADEDLEPSSYNSLPSDLSQVKPVSSNLVESHLETTSEITMPEQKSHKPIGSTGPMKFSIAGYTERSSKETSYTEKLRLGRSDSSGSSSNSSLR